MKKLTILIMLLTFTSLTIAQSVIVKDGEAEPNTLLEINDEGATGSISIPTGTTPSEPAGKLYNESGTLKWSGSALSTLASPDGDWTVSGNNMSSTVSGNVGIGKAPVYNLDVSGDINSDSQYRLNGAPFLSYSGVPFKSTFLGYDAGHGTFGYTSVSVGYEAGRGGSNSGTFVGYRAGMNTIMSNNTIIGYRAGETNTNGSSNVFIGAQAGLNNTVGSNNTFLGAAAGMNNAGGRSNLFAGSGAGSNNTSGLQNTFIGNGAGGLNESGNDNVFIGYNAGNSNIDQNGNTYIGFQAGKESNPAVFNTFVGYNVGGSNTTGNKNTYYGYSAGFLNETGTGNVFLGHLAGSAELGSDKLYIDNTNTSTPLIYGDFSTKDAIINGNLEVTVKMQANSGFNVNGTDGISGTFSFYNDGTTIGQVQSITVNGGIITSVLTISE